MTDARRVRDQGPHKPHHACQATQGHTHTDLRSGRGSEMLLDSASHLPLKVGGFIERKPPGPPTRGDARDGAPRPPGDFEKFGALRLFYFHRDADGKFLGTACLFYEDPAVADKVGGGPGWGVAPGGEPTKEPV